MSIHLSIVVPTYNCGDFVSAALDSLLNQTLWPDNVEVVVSDDCSSDNTLKVIEGYLDRLPRLRIYTQKVNLGGPSNWAFCLEQACGDYVFLLSHDDAVSCKFVENCLEIIKKYPSVDMIIGGINLHGPNFEFLSSSKASTIEGLASGITRVRDQLMSHHMVMATVYRRQALLSCGGWDDYVGSHLDCTAYCRVSLRARSTYFTPQPMLYFRIMPGTWSHGLANSNQHQLAVWYRRKLDLLLADSKKFSPDLIPFIRSMYLHHARTVINYFEIELGNQRLDGQKARRFLGDLIRVFPEARHDRLAWKFWLASIFGTWWLRVIRFLLGKPDPYNCPLALFNSFAKNNDGRQT